VKLGCKGYISVFILLIFFVISIHRRSFYTEVRSWKMTVTERGGAGAPIRLWTRVATSIYIHGSIVAFFIVCAFVIVTLEESTIANHKVPSRSFGSLPPK
jgi:hypothetical protein